MMVYVALLSCSRKKETISCPVSHNFFQQQKAVKCLIWFKNVILLNEDFYLYVLNSLSTKKSYAINDNLKNEIEKIIQGFLSGKYSNQACDVLTNLLLNLFEHCNSVKAFISTAMYIKQHFDFVVLEICGIPMQKSVVLKGVFVKKQLPNSLFQKTLLTHRLLLATFDDTLLPSSAVQFESVSSFSLSCTFYTKYLMKWLQECVKLNVSVILFQGEALATFRSLCEENDIALMDCLLEEDVNFICSALEISPTCDISEKLNSSNIIDVKLKEIQLGNQILTNFTNINSKKTIKTLLICSPSPGLCSQYKASVSDSILLLQHWMFGCDVAARSLSAGGQIETFSAHGGGLFFISLYKLLSNLNLTMSIVNKISWTPLELEMFKYGWDIISEMLVVVPQVLYQNSFVPKDKTTRFLQYLHNLNIDCAKLSNDKSTHLDKTIEPTCCLYTVLCNAINCLEKVLRIDTIISYVRNDSPFR